MLKCSGVHLSCLDLIRTSLLLTGQSRYSHPVRYGHPVVRSEALSLLLTRVPWTNTIGRLAIHVQGWTLIVTRIAHEGRGLRERRGGGQRKCRLRLCSGWLTRSKDRLTAASNTSGHLVLVVCQWFFLSYLTHIIRGMASRPEPDSRLANFKDIAVRPQIPMRASFPQPAILPPIQTWYYGSILT